MKIIESKKGKISGIVKENHTLFAGIPYAKAPIGELRWRAPVEMDAWEGVYEATKFPNSFLQGPPHTAFYRKEFRSNPDYEVGQSEDSLYLNIWVPNQEYEKPLPVAFWIHGGAFSGGHCSEIEFDGEGFCKRGVILVSINYRVNIFGFLAHEELAAQNNLGISGNYGILDQIAALQWVYDNIEDFHGDPKQITIFGQSAGSMSVQTLVSSELTKNMISKAILQSGGGYKNGLSKDLSPQEAMALGKEILDISSFKSMEELRKLSSEEIYEIGNRASSQLRAREGLIFIPNIDGVVLKEGYDTIIEKGKVKDIPYLLGATKNDMFAPENSDEVIKGPIQIGCEDWALKMEEQGKKPAYVYYFTRDLPGDDSGAFHSAELWYMFGTLDRCWRPWEEKDYRLSEMMMDYWCHFIKSGKPCESDEEWPAFNKASKYVKIFG